MKKFDGNLKEIVEQLDGIRRELWWICFIIALGSCSVGASIAGLVK